MAMMMGNLYQALLESGASDENARKAAEEVAIYDNRFAKVESELLLLKWMVGFNLTMTAAVLIKLFV